MVNRPTIPIWGRNRNKSSTQSSLPSKTATSPTVTTPSIPFPIPTTFTIPKPSTPPPAIQAAAEPSLAPSEQQSSSSASRKLGMSKVVHSANLTFRAPASRKILKEDETLKATEETLHQWQIETAKLLMALQSNEQAWHALFGTYAMFPSITTSIYPAHDTEAHEVSMELSNYKKHLDNPPDGVENNFEAHQRIDIAQKDLSNLIVRIENCKKLHMKRVQSIKEYKYYEEKTKKILNAELKKSKPTTSKEVERRSRNEGKSEELSMALNSHTNQLFYEMDAIAVERLAATDRAFAALLLLQHHYFRSYPISKAFDKGANVGLGRRILIRDEARPWLPVNTQMMVAANGGQTPISSGSMMPDMPNTGPAPSTPVFSVPPHNPNSSDHNVMANMQQQNFIPNNSIINNNNNNGIQNQQQMYAPPLQQQYGNITVSQQQSQPNSQMMMHHQQSFNTDVVNGNYPALSNHSMAPASPIPSSTSNQQLQFPSVSPASLYTSSKPITDPSDLYVPLPSQQVQQQTTSSSSHTLPPPPPPPPPPFPPLTSSGSMNTSLPYSSEGMVPLPPPPPSKIILNMQPTPSPSAPIMLPNPDSNPLSSPPPHPPTSFPSSLYSTPAYSTGPSNLYLPPHAQQIHHLTALPTSSSSIIPPPPPPPPPSAPMVLPNPPSNPLPLPPLSSSGMYATTVSGGMANMSVRENEPELTG